MSRKDIPLTLAVIYKLILHRVGVSGDIVECMPGHVILWIPDEMCMWTEMFVDVHNGVEIF